MRSFPWCFPSRVSDLWLPIFSTNSRNREGEFVKSDVLVYHFHELFSVCRGFCSASQSAGSFAKHSFDMRRFGLSSYSRLKIGETSTQFQFLSAAGGWNQTGIIAGIILSQAFPVHPLSGAMCKVSPQGCPCSLL